MGAGGAGGAHGQRRPVGVAGGLAVAGAPSAGVARTRQARRAGPGRLVRLLHDAGVDVLGIDIADVAVSLARRTGAPAQRRDVFGLVPDEGTWSTALLLDGNIGIGGDPTRLLRRVHDLLAPGGRMLVETDPDDDIDAHGWVRFARNDVPTGVPFLWARVGLPGLRRRVPDTDLEIEKVHRIAGRTFATLVR